MKNLFEIDKDTLTKRIQDEKEKAAWQIASIQEECDAWLWESQA